MGRTLDSFARLQPWLERSPTFKALYMAGLALGVTIGDSLKYKWELDEKVEVAFQEEGDIFLPNTHYWDKRITATHVVVLSHELRHAQQDERLSGLDMERDAYYYQGLVVDELKSKGYKVAKNWHPLTEVEILEAYKDYYDE